MRELQALELMYRACRQLPTVADDHERLHLSRDVLAKALGELQKLRTKVPVQEKEDARETSG